MRETEDEALGPGHSGVLSGPVHRCAGASVELTGSDAGSNDGAPGGIPLLPLPTTPLAPVDVEALAGWMVVPVLFSGRRSHMTRPNGSIPSELLNLREVERNA